MGKPIKIRAASARSMNTGLLIGGQWEDGVGDSFDVLDKFTLEPVATLRSADGDQITRMIDAAQSAFAKGAPSAHERGAILDRTAVLLAGRRAELVALMQSEAGFTFADANGEVTRSIETLKLSAEEARRLSGELIPFEGAPGQAGRFAFTLRVPLGVIAAITPFNAPLNTVLHKVAPAFAAGNAIVLKPSTQTPLTACLVVECLIEAGMPEGFVSLLHGSGSVAQAMLADERIRFFAFTGSTEVGRAIQKMAGLRRTQMELGSIAFTILCEDADLAKALPKVAMAGYRKAGQVCTSIQVLLVHDAIWERVLKELPPMVAALKYGDPHIEKTDVGPLISEREAIRVESWIQKAKEAGARELVGGPRAGSVVPPTLLTDIDQTMQVGCNEVFGPVMSLVRFSSFAEAIARVNATPYGLASGIFTNRLSDAFAAARSLKVGGVHINETSSSRVDMMPYGGSKDSGFGREGPHYAIHEMTEERLISITPGDPVFL